MSKIALSEEKSGDPEGVPEEVLEELADEFADEEEEEEPSPAEIAEVAEEVAVTGADLVDTYLKSVGRPRCSRSRKSRITFAPWKKERPHSKRSLLVPFLRYPAFFTLGQNIKQGLVKAPDVLRFPGEWHEGSRLILCDFTAGSSGSLLAATWTG